MRADSCRSHSPQSEFLLIFGCLSLSNTLWQQLDPPVAAVESVTHLRG
jgi:hypothetical protein